MSRIAVGLTLFILAAAAAEVHLVRHRLSSADASPEELRALLDRFSQMDRVLGDGAYRGEPYTIDEKTVRNSGADTYGAMQYQDSAGLPYQVYIGGAIANQESFHAPSYCLPSAGWEMLSHDSVPLDFYNTGRSNPTMRRLDMQYGTERLLVYYWFQSGDRIADHDLVVRWYRFRDLLSSGPLRPTMIVSVYIPYAGDVGAAEQRASKFLHAVGPALKRAVQPEPK